MTIELDEIRATRLPLSVASTPPAAAAAPRLRRRVATALKQWIDHVLSRVRIPAAAPRHGLRI